MESWIELDDIEYRKVWDKFYSYFNFKPSIYRRDWPSFKEPSPFITYDISMNYKDDIIDEWYDTAKKVLKECTSKNEFIYALDWQHKSYLYNPHNESAERWYVAPIPDGDYYMFLQQDFRWGILTHPWEETICIFGKDLIDNLLKHSPKMLQIIKRQG